MMRTLGGAVCALLLYLTCLPAAATPTFTTLYSFTAFDGMSPYASLFQGADGLLYGTTAYQSTNGNPSVFNLDTTGSAYADLFSFSQTLGDLVTGGVIEGGDGYLYGTTQLGGTYRNGTVYTVYHDGTQYVDIYDFGGYLGDGFGSVAGLVMAADGDLYGVTESGGAFDFGTVFKVAPGTHGITYLYSFGPNDLKNPQGVLIQAANGSLYGTAYDGGKYGLGGIFRINTDGTGYAVLHNFVAFTGDAANSAGGLVEGGDGFLYGAASSGGAAFNTGAVFKIATDGTGYQLLHSFYGGQTDGFSPIGRLLLGNDGNLYGTTMKGGAQAVGGIFEISRDGSLYSFLFSCDGSTGAYPEAGLLQGTDGKLYGTTAGGNGTIFSFATGLPASPTGVHALGKSGEVQLSWTSDTLASFYNLYRSATPGGEGATPYQTGLPIPDFPDGNVSNGVSYYYQVTAVNSGVESAKSYEVSATPQMELSGLSASPNPVIASKSTIGTLTLTQATTGPTTAFLSSSDPSVTFTSPDVTVPSGQPSTTFAINTANTGSPVTATVTASENGVDTSTALNVNVPNVLHTFQAGLQMISANTDDTGISLSNDFAQSSPELAVWTGSAYVITPTTPANTIVPGQGYWFNPTGAANLYDIGTDQSSNTPVDVSLAQGWNMIGDSFSIAVPATDLQVQAGSNAPVSFANAVTAGLVGNTFYTWQPGDAAYEVLPASSGSLQPFEGYWLFASSPCTLIFPAGG